MEYVLDLTQSFLHAAIQHPFYSFLGIFILFCFLLRLYSKVTMGICTCDQDMRGKTVLITGASAGVGKAAAFDLARRNARVLLACRNIEKANKVAEEIKKTTGNQNITVRWLDLSSFDSVRACAKNVLETESKLDVLINNAGILGVAGQKMTPDGCELIMQSNHFGHFLLTRLLLDLMKRSAPSRIIVVASSGHNFHKFDINDLNNNRNLHFFYVYANSKLANILFTKELASRLEGTEVTVNALCPGSVKTDIFDTVDSWLTLGTGFTHLIVGKTCEEGAQTTIHLAVDPALEKTTGKYFVDCKEATIVKEGLDKMLAKRVFDISEEIVGIKY
ncbi:retinol dehydrogenase 11-like [Parasteatoda tepidariorum]|uniref:retinol dehydrogenase 11-like n=1 Tax=Parasteatoda tepidariorum TaxID=114398 RepID=UPI001C71ADF6|nr:retinol dehydrogenase 11-like [Parasteatoda tepidariorum]